MEATRSYKCPSGRRKRDDHREQRDLVEERVKQMVLLAVVILLSILLLRPEHAATKQRGSLSPEECGESRLR